MKNILISAGGTGGHFFPAYALADHAHKLGHKVFVVSDERCKNYFREDDPYYTAIIDVKRISKHPVKAFHFFISLIKAVWINYRLIRKNKISCLVAFGGYPTLGSIIAAKISGIKIIIHEQNILAGKANKLFARIADKIAVANKYVKGFGKYEKKLVVTGVPIRGSFIEEAEDVKKSKKFTILVIGGSQGARVFSEIIPEIIKNLDESHIKQLDIVQQAREEDLESLKEQYKAIGVKADIKSFFNNVGSLMSSADLVISRSGASSIAEVIYLAKPAILVPYPYAVDDHQFFNAKVLSDNDACHLVRESEVNHEEIANFIFNLIEDKKYREEFSSNVAKLRILDPEGKILDLV